MWLCSNKTERGISYNGNLSRNIIILIFLSRQKCKSHFHPCNWAQVKLEIWGRLVHGIKAGILNVTVYNVVLQAVAKGPLLLKAKALKPRSVFQEVCTTPGDCWRKSSCSCPQTSTPSDWKKKKKNRQQTDPSPCSSKNSVSRENNSLQLRKAVHFPSCAFRSYSIFTPHSPHLLSNSEIRQTTW